MGYTKVRVIKHQDLKLIGYLIASKMVIAVIVHKTESFLGFVAVVLRFGRYGN